MYDAVMVERIRSSALAGLLTWALLLPSPVLSQSPVVVLYTEGLVHGSLCYARWKATPSRRVI